MPPLELHHTCTLHNQPLCRITTNSRYIPTYNPSSNTLYLHMEPLPEGNMTLEIYTNNKCTSILNNFDYKNYIIKRYVEMYQAYLYWYG